MARLGEFMPKTIAVIDGNSIMHRAFHAVPPTMTAPDGTPTNAAESPGGLFKTDCWAPCPEFLIQRV